MTAKRKPEEIRRDMERTRVELASSVEVLAERMREAADWRAHIYAHRYKVLAVAFAVGFIAGRVGVRRG